MKCFLLLLLFLATPAFGYGSRVTEIPDFEYTSYTLGCGTYCANFSTWNYAYLTRVGKNVTLCLSFTMTTSNPVSDGVRLTGMPAAFRPARDAFVFGSATVGGTWKVLAIRVRTSGEIWLYSDAALSSMPVSTTTSTNSGDQTCVVYNLQ